MTELSALLVDLRAEHEALDAIVAALPDEDWDRPTPAEPWTIRDQISHLAFFDEQARHAAAAPDSFVAGLAGISDLRDFVKGPLLNGRALSPGEVLDWWRRARAGLLPALSAADPGSRLPWYGPPMSLASFVTARLMETWAHGQDVADALGVAREPTERLRHIAFLGVRARPFSYQVRGVISPDGAVRVSLSGPAGEVWEWVAGDGDEAGTVTGPALDFCLVVTQRRHLDDTGLVVEGDAARDWIAIAQAFAGPPGEGRRPGQFS